MSHLLLPPALLPPAAYYAQICAAEGHATIAMLAPYDKRRKETHRYDIADTRGRLSLTVPVSPPHGIARARWTDVRVSGHGRWQSVHATALASAYGRTPYYEFYIDRLAPMLFAPAGTPLAEQIASLNTAVCRILLIDDHLTYDSAAVVPYAQPPTPPYWQLRASRFGFIPDLSILDLIFNLGPEAAMYIRDDV